MSSGNEVRGEIRQFLTTRRAKITPEQAGLPRYGGRRRVTGLRREEVALLAGISIEYYTRLERGNARGAPEEDGREDHPPPARRPERDELRGSGRAGRLRHEAGPRSRSSDSELMQ